MAKEDMDELHRLKEMGLIDELIEFKPNYTKYSREQECEKRNMGIDLMKANGSSYLFLNPDERTPDYLNMPKEEFKLQKQVVSPIESPWITLYFSGGKKDKINKIDIVGFLGQKGGISKEDIGLITVQDFSSYAAVKRENVRELLAKIRPEKIKGKKLKIDVSK